jgi:diacylglycerol kinase (ATP)
MFGFMIKPYKALLHSWSGFQYAWQSQWAFRLEIFILVIAIPLACFITNNLIECLFMISSIILLPMIELINSAIETTLDRIGREYHELSGFAKDMASAAMTVAGINAVIVWGVILVEHCGTIRV